MTTPRGFADPAKAAAALDTVAAQIEKEYGSLHVRWGDVLRFRRGSLDLPGNGAPSVMGAIRTINPGPFAKGTAQGVNGDTYFAVIEFSNPVHAEALLGYGNWSKEGSPHVQDQIPLMSRKEMRPVWRDRQDVEANLERPESLLAGRRIYFLTGRYGPSVVALGPASRRFRLAGVLVWPPAHSTALAISVCTCGRRNVG